MFYALTRLASSAVELMYYFMEVSQWTDEGWTNGEQKKWLSFFRNWKEHAFLPL
jgi:hypothetical protein